MDVRTVLQFAVFTRVATLLLQAVCNALIPDHAADAFSPPRAEEPRLLDPPVEALLGGLSRWDAEHFLFIAERGYLYEHNFAFLPLLPLALRAVAGVLLRPLAGWLTVRGRLLLAVAGLNSALFVLSTLALYGLGRVTLGDRRLALLSSLLLCLSPANVFLAAGYSESLFAALTFGGVWLLERGSPLRASLVLSLATAARANGLVNAGFLVYLPLRWGLTQAGGVGTRGTGRLQSSLRLIWIALRVLLTAGLGSALIILPFAVFQLYGYWTFCRPSLRPEQVSPALLELVWVKGYRVPDASGPLPVWCSQRLPLLYSYIQDAYWDVGFLRYFQLRQIPNFLLALPMAALVAMAAWTYAVANPALCLRLGLWGEGLKPGAEKPSAGFLSPRVLVYVVHAAVLLGFGFFCMHVQLLLHWSSCSTLTRCLLGYFTSYWLLGLVLHCNFLPWT
ncbi:hypothetical protein JZ751_015467 [Albula glossodonta]|uniref:GPI mannosyltransferase 2 n=1 Tax=Albula glossodonta TaxID=121402 RepID=A0A8T2N344_9TELE|nr:hypothetical protein JZ751_015467 [Albula glossodonta]